MKHLKYIFTTFAVVILAASCSQDELLEDGGDTPVTGQTQTYTFTVSPDIVMEGDAKTRSEGTDAEKPTRCFMQVFDNDVPVVNTSVMEGEKDGDSYTFTITLASDKSYDYCFYADNDNYSISDLRNITWPNTGDLVAYAHVLSGKPEEVTRSVTLKHIVTKITLKHIGDPFTVTADEKFKISFPCADAYNVLDNAASTGNGYEDFTYTFAEGKTIDDGEEVCSFYTIVPYQVENNPDITLNLHQLTQTISGIEWKSNSHVTLQGDLSEDNPKWGATSEYAQEQIDRFFKYDNGEHKGAYGLDTDCYEFNIKRDNIDDLAKVLSEILHKNIQIDLEGLTDVKFLVNEKFDDDHLFLCQYIDRYVDTYISIYIDNTSFPTYIIYIDNADQTLPDFSVVSEELNQSTE